MARVFRTDYIIQMEHSFENLPETAGTCRNDTGSGGTRGGNGGNGGNVNIIKSMNVNKFTYIVNNKGGSGGEYDGSNFYDGYSGSKGSVSENVGGVSFNW